MSALQGTIINAVAVVVGSLAGLVLPRMPERMREVVMQGLGLAILFVGLSMGLKTQNFILVIISLALGGVAGSLLRLDELLDWAGRRLEAAVKKAGGESGGIAEGFVSATLLFCVGAMAVIGAIEGALRGDHTILYTKSLLDGISSMLLTAALGIGVIFSAAALLIYQGSIALSAKYITSFLSAAELDMVVTEVSAVGGVLVAAIGLGVLNVRKVNVVNLLPSIFVIAGLALINSKWGLLG
ncbi:MAG: DUF554 domain-containing protein [Chitinispirillales bacterium]|jgi:uncharacterized membrane protein YqgA involved in biofilm formation|nr:DUF554 domain-containing protein [Chitinispirillales bacterium]